MLGVAMGLALLGKPNGYFVLAMTLPVAVLTLRGGLGHRLTRLAATLGTIIVVAGWRVAIAMHMYGTDIFASHYVAARVAAMHGQNYPARATGVSFTDMLLGAYVNSQFYSGRWFTTMAAHFLIQRTGLGRILGTASVGRARSRCRRDCLMSGTGYPCSITAA